MANVFKSSSKNLFAQKKLSVLTLGGGYGQLTFGLNGPCPGNVGNEEPGRGLCTVGMYANIVQIAESSVKMNNPSFILYIRLCNIK